jgi:enoyl-CoA hydratase/carnithine racemase
MSTPEAVFGHPGATLGLMTGWGGTQRLSRLLGRGAAMELLLAGQQISAREALDRGLVDEILPEETLLPGASQRATPLEKPSGKA